MSETSVETVVKLCKPHAHTFWYDKQLISGRLHRYINFNDEYCKYCWKSVSKSKKQDAYFFCHVVSPGKHSQILHTAKVQESCIIVRASADCTFMCFCFLMAEGKASLLSIGWRLPTRWIVLYLCEMRVTMGAEYIRIKAWGTAEGCGQFELIRVGRLSWDILLSQTCPINTLDVAQRHITIVRLYVMDLIAV